jgi:hypothetical protein
MHFLHRLYDWLTKNVNVNVVIDNSCAHNVPNPARCVFNACGYARCRRYTINAHAMFLTQDVHVSAKIVPVQRLHIQPLDGSNCIMIGRRADVRTDSSIRSSNKLTVDACSMIDSGVVSTICNADDDDDVDDGGLCVLVPVPFFRPSPDNEFNDRG